MVAGLTALAQFCLFQILQSAFQLLYAGVFNRLKRICGVVLASCLAGAPVLLAEFSELPAEAAMAALAMSHPEQERTEMVYQEVLNFIARHKAEDMAARGYFSHVNPDGYGPNFAAHEAGYDLAFGSAPPSNSIESIGVRHQNRLSAEAAAQIVFDAWLESPGHRRHVLGEVDQFRNQTAFAVGYAFAPVGPFDFSSHYFVFVSANLDADAEVTPFIEWKFETLSLAEMDHPEEDMDGDGRNFLWEYALGTDPFVADEGPLYDFGFDSEREQGVVTVSLDPDLDPKVTVVVETLTEIPRGQWSTDGVVREGDRYWAGSRDELVRLFRVRLEHEQFARLPFRPFR